MEVDLEVSKSLSDVNASSDRALLINRPRSTSFQVCLLALYISEQQIQYTVTEHCISNRTLFYSHAQGTMRNSEFLSNKTKHNI